MSMFCPNCGKELNEILNFCPYCGKEIEPQKKELSLGNKVKIYIGSLVLAPFGLYWFFKYFRDEKNKKVAYISLVITIISLVTATVVTIGYINSINDYLDKYNGTMELYTNLGY